MKLDEGGNQAEEWVEKLLVKSNKKFDSVGGMKDVIEQLNEMILWPIRY